ncbi:hypothetical protein M2272_003239 [Mycobacterium frederiksbergense]|uniref:DUF3592 domain-containing protein n=1 Tax=Mycolicibacterium frederiksbergense TaxID=117567 RepID=A0ABT6L0W4_9MYCO|nr:hypothetical protein [Mycolicibacterium frederiksbergense]MDH6196586.1 hypothetical protein [Mycolicibacterium frederiksbergense]
MWEFGILLLLVGALVVLLAPRIMRRRGIGRELAHGTLLVTGVSPRPDATGEQFVTITGVITGPTVREHVVYQRMAMDVDNWPSMGALFPVVYSPGNPDKWAFAPDGPSGPPAPQIPPGAWRP